MSDSDTENGSEDGISDAALPFLVVGVGASAGGLEALNAFFEHVEPRGHVAYVVIQHLSPDFKSMMPDLLRRHTSMPVVEVNTEMTVAPDHVYLLPPRRELVLQGGKLVASERPRGRSLTLPVDKFFTSLALEQGDLSGGVILSGSGSDGSRGLATIKAAGGFALVQSPATAQFDGMATSAISHVNPDIVAPPGELAVAVQRYARRQAAGLPTRQSTPDDGEWVDKIFAIMLAHCGVDFSRYKPASVRRRMERRMHALDCSKMSGYLDIISDDPGERDRLRDEIFIGVTRFMRDPEAWSELTERCIRPLIHSAPTKSAIRVWVPGCSSGQEAYSLAFLLADELERRGDGRDFRIFATDIDARAISRASSGAFPLVERDAIPSALAERYTKPDGEFFVVSSHIRNHLTFAVHNVLADPPFTKLQLLSCRNMLIYLNPEAQEAALDRFAFSLSPGGFLFLGPSESAATATRVFAPVDAKWKIFSRTNQPNERRRYFGGAGLRQSQQKSAAAPSKPNEQIYQDVIDRYAPPGVAVDEDFQVLHIFGNAGDYLQFRSGRAGLNLLQLLPETTAAMVSSCARRARREGGEVELSNVALDTGTDEPPHIIRVIPRDKGVLLVFFERRDSGKETPPNNTSVPVRLEEETATRIRELEREAQEMRQNLASSIQDQETVNEELQATNEELVAANEELQSTNEELQSVNEELYTVNTEYQQKIDELERVNADLEHVLSSTRAGVVILSRDLRIRRFNAGATRLFSLMERDVGRPLTDIAIKSHNTDVYEGIQHVVDGGERVELHLVSDEGHVWTVSIRRFTERGEFAGVILSLTDITHLQQWSFRGLDRMSSAIELTEKASVVLVDVDSGEINASKPAREVLGLRGDGAGQAAQSLGLWFLSSRRTLQRVFAEVSKSGPQERPIEFRGEPMTIELHARASTLTGCRMLVAVLDAASPPLSPGAIE